MGNESGVIYQIKGWQLVLSLAILIFGSGAAWATLQAQVSQTQRDVQEIKAERYVPKEDYWREIGDLKDQVNRLEGKIDAQTKLLK